MSATERESSLALSAVVLIPDSEVSALSAVAGRRT
jgi:hypothetical protein